MFDSKECEWSDLKVFFNGAFVIKINRLAFRSRQEKEFLHAAGNEPHSIQRGNKEYDGTMDLYKNAVDAINRAVMLAGGESLLDATFIVVADFAPKGTRLQQSTTLFGVEFTEEALEIAQNQKSVIYSLPFMYLRKVAA